MLVLENLSGIAVNNTKSEAHAIAAFLISKLGAQSNIIKSYSDHYKI